MSKPDLDALWAEIAAELRCLDWQVSLSYVADLVNEAGQAVYGLCTRFLDDKRAEIQIRDPASPLPEGAQPKEPLEVLLHEGVHIRLANLAATGSEIDEEQATWPLARTLYRKWGTAEARAMIAAMSAGGSRGQVIARAMAARAGGAAGALVRRSMNKTEYARALRAALAMEGDAQKGALEALAAQMEEEPAPESEKKEAKEKPAEQRAAGAEPEKKPEEKKDDKPAEQRAQVVTLADVETRAQRAAAEVLERSQLIAANRARMTDEQATLFARMPLADVKAQVAALPKAAEPPPPLKRGAVDGAGVGAADDLPEHVAQRIDDLMGVTRAPRSAISRDARGMSITNLVPLKPEDLKHLANGST